MAKERQAGRTRDRAAIIRAKKIADARALLSEEADESDDESVVVKPEKKKRKQRAQVASESESGSESETRPLRVALKSVINRV